VSAIVSPIQRLRGAQEAAVAELARSFAISGDFVRADEVRSGHINSTYRVTFESTDGMRARYVLQRINEEVFLDPRAVMRNVECVTRHINGKVLRVKHALGGQTLSLYPARDGCSWIEGPGGGLWRCYNYIEGCRTYDVVENTRQAYQAARAFGAFQELVSDLPPGELEETIPHFHDTPWRLARLLEAIERDPCGRGAGVGRELEFILGREHELDRVVEAMARGELPRRIAHNDTKINNVMMDARSDEAVCVIDLDTVMPGSVVYDFGDLVRTATSPAAEDERDLSKIELRMPMFEALVEGYMDAADGFLIGAESELLAFSAKLITLELAIRFLHDHLEGDRYFKTTREDHNLERCRAQLRLVESIEEQMDEMEGFVRKCFGV